jgi:hypothetical protein
VRRPASVTAALNIDRSSTLSGGAGSHRTPRHPWAADLPPAPQCARGPKGGGGGQGCRGQLLRCLDTPRRSFQCCWQRCGQQCVVTDENDPERKSLWRTALEIGSVLGIASPLVLGYLRIGAQEMTGYYCPRRGLIVRELRGN